MAADSSTRQKPSRKRPAASHHMRPKKYAAEMRGQAKVTWHFSLAGLLFRREGNRGACLGQGVVEMAIRGGRVFSGSRGLLSEVIGWFGTARLGVRRAREHHIRVIIEWIFAAVGEPERDKGLMGTIWACGAYVPKRIPCAFPRLSGLMGSCEPGEPMRLIGTAMRMPESGRFGGGPGSVATRCPSSPSPSPSPSPSRSTYAPALQAETLPT